MKCNDVRHLGFHTRSLAISPGKTIFPSFNLRELANAPMRCYLVELFQLFVR